MTTLDFLTHPLAERLTWTLAHFLWQGLLVAIVLKLLVELGNVRSASCRYSLSLGALLLMIAAVPITFFCLSESPVNISPISYPSAVEVEVANTRPVTGEPPAAWWQTLQPALLFVWFAGFLVSSGRLLLGWFATQTILNRRRRLSREAAAVLAGLGWRFRVSIPAVVFSSEHVSQALVVGFFRPIVLVPTAWLLELPPNLLEAVVAHELAHLRRHDLWVNLLQRIAEAILFYHPAIWWLSARLRRERELCCDEMAVAATGQRLEYAEALEFTARWALVDGRPALAAGFFGEGKMNLLHRVRCVLGISHERPTSAWPAGLLLGGLSLALLAAIYATNASTVNADDERPAAKEGERREGEARREGDKPAASAADRFLKREPAREGDRPREGADRPREGGDRPREGEVRRDGDRPRPEGAPRDGERRPPVANGENAELMALVRQLRAEVSELRAEVARLRGGAALRTGGDIRVEPRREADRPRPDAERPRPESGAREGGDRPREGADRPKPDAPREGGDRPRVEGDRPKPEGVRREGADKPKPEGERR